MNTIQNKDNEGKQIPTVLGGLQSAKTSAGVSIATKSDPNRRSLFIYPPPFLPLPGIAQRVLDFHISAAQFAK